MKKKNYEIKSSRVRLIDTDGKNLGIKTLKDAINYSENLGLDVVEIAPKANPPVCKVLDYSKMMYKEEQARRRSKRNKVITKEIKFQVNIGKNDFIRKVEKVKSLLDKKCQVTCTLILKGRQIYFKEKAESMFNKIISELDEISNISSKKSSNRGISVTFIPN